MNRFSGHGGQIVKFLDIGNIEQYNNWLNEAQIWSTPAREKTLKSKGHLFTFCERSDLDGWQQFVVQGARRTLGSGDGLMIEVFELGPDGQTWQRAEEISVGVHAYGADSSYRCLHVQLPKGITTAPKPMQVRFQASTGTEVVTVSGIRQATM
jgi:hypothetical protein